MLNDLLLTRQEAANTARVSLSTLDTAIKEGRLSVLRPSPRRILISQHALEQWLGLQTLVDGKP